MVGGVLPRVMCSDSCDPLPPAAPLNEELARVWAAVYACNELVDAIDYALNGPSKTGASAENRTETFEGLIAVVRQTGALADLVSTKLRVALMSLNGRAVK